MWYNDDMSTEENRPEHLWKPGQSGNPNGRPPMTPEEKLIKKAQRDFIKEYTESLKESLPLISPVLIAKAVEGDMQAIKEVNDRVMGKPKQVTDVNAKIETINPERAEEINEALKDIV